MNEALHGRGRTPSFDHVFQPLVEENFRATVRELADKLNQQVDHGCQHTSTQM